MDLEPIKKRIKAATKGPWVVSKFSENGPCSVDKVLHYEGEMQRVQILCGEHDCELMAHAREDLPALIKEIERYQRLGKRFVELCRECMDEDEMAPEFQELMYDFERMAE